MSINLAGDTVSALISALSTLDPDTCVYVDRLVVRANTNGFRYVSLLSTEHGDAIESHLADIQNTLDKLSKFNGNYIAG